jgi:hypothetical protein
MRSRFVDVPLAEVAEALKELEGKISSLPIRIKKRLREALKPFQVSFQEVCEEILSDDEE